MTWFKVDDHLHDHRKADRAGTHAMGMWVLAGSWCSANLTDGFVPDRVWKRYGPLSLAQRLVDAELWSVATRDGESGYEFHDWTQANPTRAKVLSERQAATERQAKRRESQAKSRRDAQDDSQGESHDPDPTRPDLALPPNPPETGGHKPTNPRALGTNPRGPKPPSAADLWLASKTGTE
jgi:hypothetical protein